MSMTTNFYTIIDLLSADKPIDYKAIALQLAKEQPDKFLEYLGYSKPMEHTWMVNFVKMVCADVVDNDSVYQQSSRILAIKLLRDCTGKGLKDAVDLHNNLRDHCFDVGRCFTPWSGICGLHGQMRITNPLSADNEELFTALKDVSMTLPKYL